MSIAMRYSQLLERPEAAQAVDALVRLDECALRDVLGLVVVLDETAQEIEDWPLVATHELVEGTPLPTPEAL